MTVVMRPLVMVLLCVVLCPSAPAQAQAPLRIGTRVGAEVPVETSGYDSAGRRDPFASLIVARPVASEGAVRPRATGLAGLAVADVSIKGVITSGQTWVAIVAAPDGTTYLARPNDRLHDAVVRRIDRDAVVFLAQVPDAAGVARPREIRKGLRPSGGTR
jgi:Tfp pilus assembly protein PilP